MFWKKKAKKAEEKIQSRPNREDIIASAKANAAAARAEIGDETLEKIRQAMMKKEASPAEQAKKIIRAMDNETVGRRLSDMLKEKE